MSWFKRKKLPAPELIEPTISLMGKSGKSTTPAAPAHTLDDVIDVTDMKDVTPSVSEPSFTEAPVEQSIEEPVAVPELSISVKAVEPAETAETAEHADPVKLAKDTKAEASAKAPGKFANLSAKFKRKGSDAAASTPAVVEETAGADQALTDVAETESQTPVKTKGKKEKAPKVKKEKHKFSAAPIRVVIGFLPEVTERDALEYAVGIAEKHFEQVGMSYFDAFKYGNGFAFEAHEGGTGKAYLPEIIRYFDAQGAFVPGEDVGAVIRTATRSVEVQRTRDGLVAVILPERDATPTSDWLEPTSSMQPAINKRTGFLVVGAALFTTGFIAMIITSMLTRYQEYDPAPEPVRHRIEAGMLPIQQWSRIEAVPSGSFVKALRYRNGRWESPEIVALAAVAPAHSSAPPAASAPGAPGAPSVPPTPAVPTSPAKEGTAP